MSWIPQGFWKPLYLWRSQGDWHPGTRRKDDRNGQDDEIESRVTKVVGCIQTTSWSCFFVCLVFVFWLELEHIFFRKSSLGATWKVVVMKSFFLLGYFLCRCCCGCCCCCCCCCCCSTIFLLASGSSDHLSFCKDPGITSKSNKSIVAGHFQLWISCSKV